VHEANPHNRSFRPLSAQNRTPERLQRIVAAADAVLAVINKDELRRFGPRAPTSDSPEAQAAKAERDAQRAALQDALLRKGLAQAELALGPLDALTAQLTPPRPLVSAAARHAAGPSSRSSTPAAGGASPAGSPRPEPSQPVPVAMPAPIAMPAPAAELAAALDATWAELEQWADIDEAKYLPLRVAWERANGRLAAALKHLQRYLNESEVKSDLQPYFALRRYGPQHIDSRLCNVLTRRAAGCCWASARLLLLQLGWSHWDAYEAAWNIIRFPPAQARF